MTQDIDIFYGSSDNYKALGKWDDNALYFLEDSHQIFKGSEEYTKSVEVVSALPQTKQRQGIIYVRKSDLSLWRYTGSMYERIGKGYVTKIPTDGSATDDTVPTTKAVVDYLAAKIGESGKGIYVCNVGYSEADHAFIVDRGNGTTPSYVKLNGMAATPTWNSEQRILTVPVVGSDPLVINFGKDSVVKSGLYNPKTENLELTITTGETVYIPVSSLVNIYTGESTPTVSMTVTDDNKIKANVRVSPAEGNRLQATDSGLYVGDVDRYSNDEIDIMLSNFESKVNPHLTNTTVHITEAERESWNAKAGTEELAKLKDSLLASANSIAQTKADEALEDAKAWANGLNSTLGNEVSELRKKLTWKQIPEKDANG